MQEKILARKIEVLCGDTTISWDVMSEFATNRFNTIPLFLLVKDSSSKRRNSRTGRGSCALLEAVRSKTAGDPLSAGGIASLLWIGAEKEFTDYRDRAFALVGLIPPDMRDRVLVDYGADDTESVISLGRLMLERLPNLFTLSLKRPTSFSRALPSWCPDFYTQLSDLNTLSHFYGFCAGFSSTDSNNFTLSIAFGQDYVGTDGCAIDTIRTVVKTKFPIPIDSETRQTHSGFCSGLLDWEKSCRETLFQTCPQGLKSDTMEVYSRTLAANHFDNDDIIPPEHTTYNDFLTTTRVAASFVPKAPMEYELPIAEGSLSRYVGALELHSSRRFFNTTSDRIGMGPEDMQSGDVICVLYSGKPLYVLRPDKRTDTYTYVGEAYLHGFMDLDQIPDEYRGNDEVFWIT